MGLAAAAAGCQFDKVFFGGSAPMAGYVAPRLKRIRIGFVGRRIGRPPADGREIEGGVRWKIKRG